MQSSREFNPSHDTPIANTVFMEIPSGIQKTLIFNTSVKVNPLDNLFA
jgi:hypothetical protein